jgi:hypothetical protein
LTVRAYESASVDTSPYGPKRYPDEFVEFLRA